MPRMRGYIDHCAQLTILTGWYATMRDNIQNEIKAAQNAAWAPLILRVTRYEERGCRCTSVCLPPTPCAKLEFLTHIKYSKKGWTLQAPMQQLINGKNSSYLHHQNIELNMRAWTQDLQVRAQREYQCRRMNNKP